MIDRRSFLQWLAAAAFGPAKLDRIGVQLYTVRETLQQDFDRTLGALSRIGYREVEFAGYFGRTATQVRDAVLGAGLQAPGSHVPFERLGTFWTRTLDEVRAAGHSFIVVPWVPDEVRKTGDDWRRLAELFNRSGHAARAAGLRFAYHNQVYDFRETDGVVPFEVLAAGTDPDALAFELDVYWAVRAGADPAAVLDRYPGRFPLLHLKDVGPAGEMKDVGAGTIDWAALLSHRAAAGVEHVFVEHDEPRDPFRSLSGSYRYLRKLRS